MALGLDYSTQRLRRRRRACRQLGAPISRCPRAPACPRGRRPPPPAHELEALKRRAAQRLQRRLQEPAASLAVVAASERLEARREALNPSLRVLGGRRTVAPLPGAAPLNVAVSALATTLPPSSGVRPFLAAQSLPV